MWGGGQNPSDPMALVNLPSAANVLTDVGSSSSPVFNELLPIGLFAVGFLIGGLVVYALIHWVINGFAAIIHRDHPDKYT